MTTTAAETIGYAIPDQDQGAPIERFVCLACYTVPCADATPETATVTDTYFPVCSRCGRQTFPTGRNLD